jgi:serine/threonine protein kinase
MAGEVDDSSAQDDRVDEAIAAYLEAVDAGRQPDRAQFIAEHGDIADELQAFFADRDRFDRLAEPLQAAACTPSQHPDDVARAPLDQPRRFGDYELLEEIGRGGMGVVYKARQISLNRTVALKMILAGQLASGEEVQRFHREAQAAANLDHPGIVPIYEVGEHDGQHYFSMGYVDGWSLAARLREGPVPSRQAAELLMHLCEAIHYAHEHGLIHRDLKPANILLEKGDKFNLPEPTTTCRLRIELIPFFPRITDFGLAKRLTGDADLTGTGQILGTPSYMSSEQATGQTHCIGPASDVYSLGAILYEMLTGRPPFQAETPLDTLLQVIDSEPAPPRLLNRNVPRDLEAICKKCLGKVPSRRYASAGELRDDLRRYLEGESVRASGVNLLDRLTSVLGRSRHEEQFREWGLGLMAFGLVILLSHVAIFAMARAFRDPLVVYWLPRSVMFAALLVMLWRFRHQSILPTNSAERLIWAVWIGYVLALGAVNLVRLILGDEQRESYAWFAILAGLGFLAMGAHIWGGGYVVGLVFMLAAPLLAAYTDFAPLAFGALWAGALWTFGLYYWRRGRATQTTDAATKR